MCGQRCHVAGQCCHADRKGQQMSWSCRCWRNQETSARPQGEGRGATVEWALARVPWPPALPEYPIFCCIPWLVCRVERPAYIHNRACVNHAYYARACVCTHVRLRVRACARMRVRTHAVYSAVAHARTNHREETRGPCCRFVPTPLNLNLDTLRSPFTIPGVQLSGHGGRSRVEALPSLRPPPGQLPDGGPRTVG